MIYVDNEEERTTQLVARCLAPHLRASDCLVLSGDLGAGKTYFTRALLYALGLDSEERVTSPTFTLVHEYLLELKVLHADLYRLSDPDEIFELGLFEARQAGNVLIVEWGRPHVAELGEDILFLDLSSFPRRLQVSGEGERAHALTAALSLALGERAKRGPIPP